MQRRDGLMTVSELARRTRRRAGGRLDSHPQGQASLIGGEHAEVSWMGVGLSIGCVITVCSANGLVGAWWLDSAFGLLIAAAVVNEGAEAVQ